MAEHIPAPPIPRSTVVTDLCVQTPWSIRRTRFYWLSDTAPTGLTDLEAICNKVHLTIGSNLTPFLSNQCTVLRVEGRWYGPGTSGWEANSTGAGLEGEIVAVTPNSESDLSDSGVPDTLPDECTMIVQKRTGNTGRSTYGRWFFSGLHENIQNAGQIDRAVVAAGRTFANTLSDDLTVAGAFSTILHARHWDKKNNVMRAITKCYLVRALGTRKDRRRPLKLERA